MKALGNLPTSPPSKGDYNRHLGEFGEKWFESICAAACLEASSKRVDNGIDYVVEFKYEVTYWQIKATESPKRLASGDYSFALNNRRLTKLTDTKTHRAFLCLVVARAPHPRWTAHIGGPRGSTIVRATGYFLETSNLSAPDNDDPAQTTTLTIPHKNLVTPKMLAGLYA